MKKDRARIAILSELMSFPTINQKDWQSGSMRNDAQVDDLVSLQSAPSSKWYLSWLREIDFNDGWTKYLLESIDDGELCWWENVGLNVYSRERVNERPMWRWCDKQFAFNNRWIKVCKRNDAFIVRPISPVFNDDESVELNVRIRHGSSGYRNPQTFPNWKKLTMKEMEVYYLKSVDEYNAK